VDTADPIPQTSIQPVARWGASTTADNRDPPDANANVFPAWGFDTTWGYNGCLDNTSNHSITYTFGKNFDQGASLVIDGQTVINNNSNCKCNRC
jgi:hypothetical protein